MKSPTYSWRCYKCESVNPPEAEACTSCKFPSRPNGKDFSSLRASRPISTEQLTPESTEQWWSAFTFFPEGLLAFFIVLSGPAWILNLVASGQFLLALNTMLAGGASIFIFTIGVRKKSELITYAGVFGVLLVGWASATHTP